MSRRREFRERLLVWWIYQLKNLNWTEGSQFKVYVIAVSSFIESYREVYHRFLTHLIKISIPVFVGNNKVHIITHVLFNNSEKKNKTKRKKKKKTKTAN